MEAVHIKKLFSISWLCESGLVDNVELVVEEYRQNRGLLVGTGPRFKITFCFWTCARSAMMCVLCSPSGSVFWVLLRWGRVWCPDRSVSATNSITSG